MSRRILFLIFIILTSYSFSQELYWYKSQTALGTTQSASAIIAMSVHWATNENVTFQSIRSRFIQRLSSNTFDSIQTILSELNIQAKFENLRTVEDLIEHVFHRGRIVVVFINPSHIEIVNRRSYGRTHYIEIPHFVILYDHIGDAFQVHDPIVHGESRLYKIDQVWRALREKRALIISK